MPELSSGMPEFAEFQHTQRYFLHASKGSKSRLLKVSPSPWRPGVVSGVVALALGRAIEDGTR
eukprot:537029-Prymnesium_polylepis.1